MPTLTVEQKQEALGLIYRIDQTADEVEGMLTGIRQQMERVRVTKMLLSPEIDRIVGMLDEASRKLREI